MYCSTCGADSQTAKAYCKRCGEWLPDIKGRRGIAFGGETPQQNLFTGLFMSALSMVAALIGFITLIIAHHLATSGDTLEMMRAVLDSNFWLATHVVCITIGYGSTFLSGFLGVLFILRCEGRSATIGRGSEERGHVRIR